MKLPKFTKNKKSKTQVISVHLPVHIIIGHLAGVSQKDVYAYAIGLVETLFDAPKLTRIHLEQTSEGWIYELHEGGNCAAFVPTILEHFRESGDSSVIIDTATRKIKVEKDKGGLISILLPETREDPTTLEARFGMMAYLYNDGTNYLKAGFIVLVVGLAITLGAMFFALRTPTIEIRPESYAVQANTLKVEDLPVSQWSKVLATPSTQYVKKLSFEHGKWLIDRQPIQGAGQAPTANAAAQKQGIPGVGGLGLSGLDMGMGF